MVKVNFEAVRRQLEAVWPPRRLYSGTMPKFTLAGASFEYLASEFEGDREDIHSWEYGQWLRVESEIPLQDPRTVSVYGEAMRWGNSQILIRWGDDEGHMHSAWLPKGNVRRLTASEWDIIEYRKCPPELRAIRWRKRLPGFLPE